jgi:hypothetical protein
MTTVKHEVARVTPDGEFYEIRLQLDPAWLRAKVDRRRDDDVRGLIEEQLSWLLDSLVTKIEEDRREKRGPWAPKVTRPRELVDSHGVTWRVVPSREPALMDRVEYRERNSGEWHDALSIHAGNPGLTVEVARIVTELAANPTEEVDAE